MKHLKTNKQSTMKNIVIILENLPDELVEKGFFEGLKEVGVKIEKPEMRLDWNTMSDVEKARTIEAFVKLQTNFAYQAIQKLPPIERTIVMTRLYKEGMEKLFKNNFGGFNMN